MANKHKKKRNKSYQGADARVSAPAITRVSAVSRHPVHQWLYDRRRIIRPALITAAVVFVITLVIIEIIRMTSDA